MTDFDRDLEFVFTLTDILRGKRAQFAADVARVSPELTPGAARILVFAGRSGPISQVALARRASLEPMTISGFVTMMEKQGFVRRGPDPSDGRSKLIHLTAKGEDHLERILASMRLSEAQSRALASKADWQKMMALLDKVRLEQEKVARDLPEPRAHGAPFS